MLVETGYYYLGTRFLGSFTMIKIFNLEANPFTDQVTTPIDRNGNSGQEMRLQPQNDTGGNEMVMQQ